MIQCIKGNGGRLAAVAIKRFMLLERGVPDDQFFDAMHALWKEKHGHALAPTKPKAPKRVKTDSEHKYCNGCQRVLGVGAFSVDRSRKSGLANRCRECAAANWKRANRRICKSCESWCVGQICQRCLFVKVRVAEVEWDVLSTIPQILNIPIEETRRQRKWLNQGKTTLKQIRQILTS